jgi:hypothetical protein
MNSQIEEFLRRMMAETAPANDDDDDIIDAEIVEDDAQSERRLSDSAGSVFADTAGRLGDVIEHADERLEEHLHEEFDHRLGQFESQPAEDAGEVPADLKTRHAASADLLKEMLKSPKSVQNAVLLSEILNRPEHRW